MEAEKILDEEFANDGNKAEIDFTPDEMKKGDIITAKIFTLDQKAQFYKAKLISEGIKCFLTNENTANILSGYTIGLGGLELKILKRDEEAALNIINLLDHRDLSNDEESYDASLQEGNNDFTFRIIIGAVIGFIILTLGSYLLMIL